MDDSNNIIHREVDGPGVAGRRSYLLIWGLVFLFIGYGLFLVAYGYSMKALSGWALIPTMGIIVFIFYIVIHRNKDENTYRNKAVNAATLLEQFAKGDITHEQYSRMREEIQDRTQDYMLIRQ